MIREEGRGEEEGKGRRKEERVDDRLAYSTALSCSFFSLNEGIVFVLETQRVFHDRWQR